MNLIYVACTRATHQLILINSTSHNWLNNWDRKTIKDMTTYLILKQIGKPKNKHLCTNNCDCKNKSLSVTDISKNKTCDDLSKLIDVNKLHMRVSESIIHGSSMLGRDKVIMKNGLTEKITPVMGVLVPIIIEFHQTHEISMISHYKEIKYDGSAFVDNITEHMNSIRSTYKKLSLITDYSIDNLINNHVEDFGYLATAIMVYRDYIYPLIQIDNYEWINKDYVRQLCGNLLSYINSIKYHKISYESPSYKVIPGQCIHDNGRQIILTLHGRFDICHDNTIVEIKMTNTLDNNEYMVQLMIYMWMNQKNGVLYSPNMGKIITIKVTNWDKYNNSVKNWFNDVMKKYDQFVFYGYNYLV